MKTKKLLSLVLAVLMIASAIPMVFVPATAATAGTAPATLPNGKTYAGTPFHTYDVAAKYQENSSGWWGGFGAGVQAMIQDGAEGLMFKIDTTNAAASTNGKVSMTFAISLNFNRLSDGVASSTYLIATPAQAAGWSGHAKAEQGQTSTWYYSQDGATWTPTSTTGTNVEIPTGKQVTYVFVPMDAFWTKEAETFLKTGTNVNTEQVVNWLDAREMIEDNYYFGSVRYLFSGSDTPAKDANVTINNWQVVDHVEAVADMTTAAMFSTNPPARPSWTGGSYYSAAAPTHLKNAKGLLVEVDNSAATASAFSVMMSLNRGDGKFNNAYLISTFGQANGFGASYVANGSGVTAKDQSSVAYWSKDGVSWTGIASSGSGSTMPETTSKAYVYIPFESFWTRHAECDIGVDSSLSQHRIDKNDMMAALGDGWKFGYIHIYGGDGMSFSNWRFVFDSVDAAPETLPNGDSYAAVDMFADSNATISIADYASGEWIGDAGRQVSSVSHLNSADGVMLKIDSSAVALGTDSLAFTMLFEVNVNKAGWIHLATNAGGAAMYGRNKAPAGTATTWYYSIDGENWNAISSSAYQFPVTDYRGDIYLYMPLSDMYYDASLSQMQTGTSDYTLPSATRDEVIAAGYLNMNTGNNLDATCRVRLSIDNKNNNKMCQAKLTDWKFVYTAKSSADLPSMSTNHTVDIGSYDIARPSWHGGAHLNPNAIESFKTADGVVFQIDTSASTTTDPAQMSFFLSVSTPLGGNGGNNYFCATVGHANDYGEAAKNYTSASIWYWSEDGENWEAIVAPSVKNKMTLPAKNTKAYVYVPFDSFWSRYDADYISGKSAAADSTKPRVSYAEYREAVGDNITLAYLHSTWGSGNTSTLATCSNWSFVYLDLDKSVMDTAPATLPGSTEKYVTTQYLDTTKFPSIDYDKSGDWIGTVGLPGVGNMLADAKGIIVKFDTSNVTTKNDSNKGFTLAMTATGNNGVGTYLCATVNTAMMYGAVTKPAGAYDSVYMSTDGMTWTERDDAGKTSNGVGVMTPYCGVQYIYIPVEAMYMRHGATTLSNGAVEGGTALTFAEATELVGGWSAIGGNVAFWFNGAAAGAEVIDIVLVHEMPDILDSASISLKESFTYNVYTDVPSIVDDVELSLTWEGETVALEGVAQTDGRVKYSFAGILPQQIAEDITVTATYTLQGEKKTVTVTESILDYLKAMLADDAYAAWHELAQATINYAAAAQDYKGVYFEGTKIDAADVKELANAVTDYSTLAGANTIDLALGAESGFNSAALSLEDVLKVKITVGNAITAVTYSINGRTGTLNVENGAVYVPVYANEMGKTITVTDANNAEDVLNVSVNWYIANLSTSNANLVALINAIANYGAAAAAMK